MRTETKTAAAEGARDRQLHYAGIHRQEDRDARFATRAAGAEKQFWHMIRIRVPLGALSAGQYLALDDLAGRVSYNDSLRVTAGQSVQLHGVTGADLPRVLAALAETGLAAGCHESGMEFAIAAPPAPVETEAYVRLRGLGSELCDELYPRPGRDLAVVPEHSPRKFTVGLGIEEDNSANVFAHDTGLLLLAGRDGSARVNVYAGGSLSMPGRRADTYARLGSALGSLAAEQALAAVKAVARVFKEHGQLATRRHTRLKYLVDRTGVEEFRRLVENELGRRFEEPEPHGTLRSPSWCGLRDQQNGEFYYGLGIPYGRIQDQGLARYKAAARLIVQTFHPRVILTPGQNIIFAGLRIGQIEPLERILEAYHVPHGDRLSRLRFEAMACAGLPTCPAAVAESERVAPRIVGELEALLARLGRGDAPFGFRISGCSIGCIRPNMTDLGAVGRKPGHYDLYTGGNEAEARFGQLYAENVPLEEIVATVRPVLACWAERGAAGETFSEFYARAFGGGAKPQRLNAGEQAPARGRVERIISEVDLHQRAGTAGEVLVNHE